MEIIKTLFVRGYIQCDEPTTSNVHKISKVSQHDESKYEKENMQSSFVLPSSTIVEHEKFQKFVPSIEIKVSHKIIKRVKIKEDLEEQVIEHQVFIEDTT